MADCKYGDPTCPCQDGDICHYEGENPMSVPPEYVRAKCERLEKVIENVAWMLDGDLTEEALKNLKAYVSRKRATLTEEPSK